jgi:two-component sensor histidine kinase
LEANPPTGYALTVADEGPGLPEGFDPAARKGLGMKIIRSLVDRIDGELRIGRGANDRGAQFTVLFS